MKPGPLDYRRPQSVDEAVDELAGGGLDAKVVAGGQSLVPMLNLRMVAAEKLIDIKRIPALNESSSEAAEVRLGACVTHEQIQTGAVPDPSNGLMPYVASRIAYQAVRNRGTIGGSLALADPAADWVTTMAALGATIEWQGPDGVKSCLAEDFVLGAYMTQLEPSDLLTSIRIPRLGPDARWGAYKLCRKVGEFAHAMAMVIRHPTSARAFLGATDGAPIRLRHVEGMLSGLDRWTSPRAATLLEALDADLAASERTLSDVHAWQSRTCLVRAMRRSFGIEDEKVESL